jgi:hypothetical protein
VVKFARGIRAWLRWYFSAQDYNERLAAREGDRDDPLAVRRGRMRWFG